MTRILFTLFLFLIGFSSNAQHIEKWIAANVGEPFADAGTTINFTIGEPIVGPISNNIAIGQGFWAGGLVVEPLGPVENYDDIAIYPNPVTDVLTIFTGNKELVGTTLFAVNGQRVLRQRINERQLEQEIDLSYLTKGVYVLRLYIRGDTNGKLFKIIKK